MLEIWGMQSTSSLLSLPGPLWTRVVTSGRVLSIGQIELSCVLMLNWIARNKTVLTLKQRTYSNLKRLKWNCFCMLNWNVRNRTVFDIETVPILNWIVWNITVLTFNILNWIVWIRTIWLNYIAWNRNFFDS